MSSRPSSGRARSRPNTASKNSRPMSGVSNRSFAMYDGEGGAMDIASYSSDSRVSGQKSTEPVLPEEKGDTGCFGKFKSGLRSVWATRQSEDTAEDKELYITTTLRELVVYCIFLIVLMILTFAMTSGTMYYYTQVMSNLFIGSSIDGGSGPTTFNTIGNADDFWQFLQNPLMSGLYWDKWYNNMNVSADERNFIYFENKLLGVPRIRQVRVKPNSCEVPSDFQGDIKTCYAAYDSSVADKEPYGPMSSTAWNYTDGDLLDGMSYDGLMGSYDTGGYFIDLGRFKDDSVAIITDLFDNLWINRGTRAVFVDFTVYNANINLFCVIKMIVEFPATGGAMAAAEFRTVKLLRYVTPMDYFVLACECIFLAFILYYIIEEIIEIRKNKFDYFKHFWNWLDIIVITISLVCTVFNVYRTIAVGRKLEQLLSDANKFPDFDFLSFWQLQFNNALAITVFFAWVKIFKYISFNKTMTQLSSTLGACAKDLAGFAVMFFIIFFAFAQLGYLIFGAQVQDFQQFSTAIFTLFRIILGDFNFAALEAANSFLGPLYFILYVFFVFFILINMFLAIINDTYSEVKEELADQENEFEMGDYFKQRANVVMDKLNFKRDKIMDIQKAIKAADINKDNRLDFDEWRSELKARGYADAEIEAVFSKYDLDGDRVLDESEQKKMQIELEGQKKALNAEIEKEQEEMDRTDLDDGTGVGVSGGGGGGGGGGRGGISMEEFTILTRRVDRMESSIGSIVGKIDSVLMKLEEMERTKLMRRETMGKMLDSITGDEEMSEEEKRAQMENLVRQEMSKWESESAAVSRAETKNSARMF